MKCEEVRERLERIAMLEAMPEEVAGADQHRKECTSCQKFWEALVKEEELMKNALEPWHPQESYALDVVERLEEEGVEPQALTPHESRWSWWKLAPLAAGILLVITLLYAYTRSPIQEKPGTAAPVQTTPAQQNNSDFEKQKEPETEEERIKERIKKAEERIKNRERPIAVTPMVKARFKINDLQEMIEAGAGPDRLRSYAEEAEAAQKEYVKTITNTKSSVFIHAEQELIKVMIQKGKILSQLALRAGGDHIKKADFTFKEIIIRYEGLRHTIGNRPDPGSPEEIPWEYGHRMILKELIHSIWLMCDDFYRHFKEYHGEMKSVFEDIVLKRFDELTLFHESHLATYEVALYVGDIQMLVAAAEEAGNREKNFNGAISKYGLAKALSDKAELRGKDTVRELVAIAHHRIIKAYILYADLQNQPQLYQRAVDTATSLFTAYPNSKDEGTFLDVQLEQARAYLRSGEQQKADAILNKLSQKDKTWEIRVRAVRSEKTEKKK